VQLERAKSLLAHCAPGKSLGELHLQAMKLLVQALEKQKFAVTIRPRRQPSTPTSETMPPRHGLPVRDGDEEPGKSGRSASSLLQITLVHLCRWWRSRSEGRIGFGAPMSTGALTVPARHERSRRRRSTSRHRACPPLQRRQSGQARNLRAVGRDRCAQSRVAPVSAHFSTRASLKNATPKGALSQRVRTANGQVYLSIRGSRTGSQGAGVPVLAAMASRTWRARAQLFAWRR
jgi:hypothetical protein